MSTLLYGYVVDLHGLMSTLLYGYVVDLHGCIIRPVGAWFNEYVVIWLRR